MKGIFISVRTGSTRLPQKALKKIRGRSTIEYLIDRVKKSEYAQQIILCTTEMEEDNVLCELAMKNDIKFFRGSSPDKLKRWLYAAKHYDVDFFVNADGDDIFFDHGLADLVFKQFEDTGADFIDGQGLYNDVYGMTRDSLEKVVKEKKSTDTEFIKPYFYSLKDRIMIEEVRDVPEKYKKKKMRLTLDYEEDFLFFKAVIEYFLEKNEEMEFSKIIDYVERTEGIVDINFHREKDWFENQQKVKNV